MAVPPGQPFVFLCPFPGFSGVVFAGKQAIIPAAKTSEKHRHHGCLKAYLPVLLGPLLLTVLPTAFAQTATTTILAVTSGGSAVTSITSGTVVRLTAMVTAGTTPVTPGLANFSDATAAYCEDIHILGTAQLTSTGTAIFNFQPSVGSHSYKAVFVGMDSDVGSASGTSAQTVTRLHPTATAVAQSGSGGNYALTATVGGTAGTAPTGTVSFLDTTEGNASLGTAPLNAGPPGLNFVNSSTLAASLYPESVAVADFLGNGTEDLAVTSSCDGEEISG